jgi:hypothetical protein
MAKLSIQEEVAKAKAAGVSKFVSMNVHDCGTTLRYTNCHGECVHCKSIKNKTKSEDQEIKESSIGYLALSLMRPRRAL